MKTPYRSPGPEDLADWFLGLAAVVLTFALTTIVVFGYIFKATDLAGRPASSSSPALQDTSKRDFKPVTNDDLSWRNG